MLSPEEAKDLLALLARTQINFGEAEAVVNLKNKLISIANSKEPKEKEFEEN